MNQLKPDTDIQIRIDQRLQRIANVLLLNTSFIDNLGLLNGKMGIAIFFYHYSRYTDNEVYETYAGELIDEIFEEINQVTPVDFANGLTGIGWGIEYLAQNGFVEADTDEVLEELDQAIYKARLNRPILIEKSNDLFGFGFYYLSRLYGHEKDDENLKTLMKKHHLIFLTDECERFLIHKRFLDYNIPVLRLATFNSIVYFLLEMYRLDLFPSKVNKLLRYLPVYLDFSFNKELDETEKNTMLKLIEEIQATISDDEGLPQFNSILIDKAEQTSEPTNEQIVDSFIKSSWHPLVYGFNHSSAIIQTEFHQKAFEIIDNEEDWNLRLDLISSSNLGLTSFAGIALGLMAMKYKGKREMKSEKINELAL